MRPRLESAGAVPLIVAGIWLPDLLESSGALCVRAAECLYAIAAIAAGSRSINDRAFTAKTQRNEAYTGCP